MIVTIDVTQDDIEHGHASDCDACPIALAVRRCLRPGVTLLGVNSTRVEVWGDRYYYSILPDIAREFIGAFDSALRPLARVEPCKPFAFEALFPAHLFSPEFLFTLQPTP